MSGLRITDSLQAWNEASSRHWESIPQDDLDDEMDYCKYCGEPCDAALDMCDSCWEAGRG